MPGGSRERKKGAILNIRGQTKLAKNETELRKETGLEPDKKGLKKKCRKSHKILRINKERRKQEDSHLGDVIEEHENDQGTTAKVLRKRGEGSEEGQC